MQTSRVAQCELCSAQQYMRERPSHSPQSGALQRITRKTFSLCKQQVKGLKITRYFFFSCKITVSVIEQLNLIKHQSLINAFHALT